MVAGPICLYPLFLRLAGLRGILYLMLTDCLSDAP